MIFRGAIDFLFCFSTGLLKSTQKYASTFIFFWRAVYQVTVLTSFFITQWKTLLNIPYFVLFFMPTPINRLAKCASCMRQAIWRGHILPHLQGPSDPPSHFHILTSNNALMSSQQWAKATLAEALNPVFSFIRMLPSLWHAKKPEWYHPQEPRPQMTQIP